MFPYRIRKAFRIKSYEKDELVKVILYVQRYTDFMDWEFNEIFS